MERKSLVSTAVGSVYFVPAVFALLKLALHFAANAFPPYEFFRDELYYIVSTDHLSAGYVDHPPLSIWILSFSRLFFGDSLFAIRLLPAIAGSVMVFLTGLMVRELGGGRSAQVVACSAAFVSLAVIAGSVFYSMNAWVMVVWSGAFLILLKLARRPSPVLWLDLGLILGLGLLNKIDVLWLGAGIGAGLVLTPLRTELRRSGPWLAGAFALFLFVPYIAWNAVNDWAHLEFIRNASALKYSGINPLDVLLGQIPANNPVTFPLWTAGLVFFFLPSNRSWRIIGIVFVTVLVILIVNGTSKAEYLAPAVPVLFAGGAVFIDRIRARRVRLSMRAAHALLCILGLAFIPLVLPILPVDQYIRYARAIGYESKNAESHRMGDLPQFFADMHGWRDLAATVDTVFRSLPEAERRSCAIFAQNYGQASAITIYGRPYGLPPAISGHNSYFLWGPGEITDPSVVIVVGGSREDNEGSFEDVRLATTYTSPHIMPYEDHKAIYVCRKLKKPLSEVWPGVKEYI